MAVCANRRRIRVERGKRLHRLRGELIERPFAHLYETGACDAPTSAVTRNMLKRRLIHTAGFNLGLLLRTLFGTGTPRGLEGCVRAFLGLLHWLTVALEAAAEHLVTAIRPRPPQALPAAPSWRTP